MQEGPPPCVYATPHSELDAAGHNKPGGWASKVHTTQQEQEQEQQKQEQEQHQHVMMRRRRSKRERECSRLTVTSAS